MKDISKWRRSLLIRNYSMTWCIFCGERCYTLDTGLTAHLECVDLPKEVNHSLHKHPLILEENKSAKRCDMCKRSTLFQYRCSNSDCDYGLDVKCASLTLTTETEGEGDSVVCFQRPNKFYEYYCDVCLRKIEVGDVFYNTTSKRFLHKLCTDLPLQINIMHVHRKFSSCAILPQYLRNNKDNKSFMCNSCGQESLGDYYHCGSAGCTFYLDVHCAFLVPIGEHVPYHNHNFINCKQSRDIQISCSSCEQLCKGSVHQCFECHAILDDSCTHIPMALQHPFHPQHCLVFRHASDANTSFRCNACDTPIRGLMHACSDKGCNFALHPKCAWPLPPKISCKDHPHPLVLLNKPYTSFTCFSCKKVDSNTFCYCHECKYYLHLGCVTDLPPQVNHDEHTAHPLSLKDDYHVGFSCDVCDNERLTTQRIYCCIDCRFDAHIECCIDQIIEISNEALKKEDKKRVLVAGIEITTSVSAENGQLHPLVLLDKANAEFTCNFCSVKIDDPFLCCLQCECCLHLHCFPEFHDNLHCFPELPNFVYHDKHNTDHPLSLKNPVDAGHPLSFPSDGNCDVCKLDVKLLASTYACRECNFDAHIVCCMDQIKEHYENLSKEEALKKEDQKEDQANDETEDQEDEEQTEHKTRDASAITAASKNQVVEANDGASLTEVPKDPVPDGQMVIEKLELDIARLDEEIEALKKVREEKVQCVRLIAHMFQRT